jgi:transposase InsO family protein
MTPRSTPSQWPSTTGPARHSGGEHPPKPSTTIYYQFNQPVLQRPIELGQYTSARLARFARDHDLVRSVSRTAVWDNAAAESFWATLKVEFYDQYLWPTKLAAKLAVGDWIERVCNRRRRHSALGMISPAKFENRFTQSV